VGFPPLPPLSPPPPPKPEVVAAVLVYRALTWGLPILVGVGCLLWWRRQSLSAPADTTSSTGAARP
jgi:hypothetical protein